jgi:hypothetical protein
MQIWSSDVVCKEPVANGFSCGAVNKIIFKHAGSLTEVLTWAKVQNMINKFGKKVCQKCMSKKWQVTSLTPIAYISRDKAKRL